MFRTDRWLDGKTDKFYQAILKLEEDEDEAAHLSQYAVK